MSEHISKHRRSVAKAGAVAAVAPILNALLGRAAHAADETRAPSGAWYVRGTIVETCSCEIACPCAFGNPPSAGHCEALVGWHVDNGRSGDVGLDGLNVLLSFYSPGPTAKGNWRVGWYVDERASAQQREALANIFSGKAGGPLAFFAGSLVAERLGVKPARISYESTGKRHRMTISDIAELDISAVDGRDGSVVTIGNLPVGLHTSDTRVVAKSNRLTYRDLGFNWSLSGKNGNYSTFVYSPT